MVTRFRPTAVGALALAISATCLAQSFPDHPIKMLAPFPAGGSSDAVARLLANKLSSLGQPVTVENRVGATGSLAVQGVINAPADGHTLLFHTSAVVITPWLTKAPYDPLNDLQPVTRPAATPYVMVVRPTLAARNLDEFIELARKNPGKLSCSSYGVGSPPHLALEMLKKAAGVHILHVPYRGFAQSLPDLASGLLDCSLDSQMNYQPYVQSGAVRAIAITDDKPSKVYPNASLIAAKYPSAKVVGWQGIFVKKGTPPAVLDVLQRELRKAISSPEVAERLSSSGFEPVADTPEVFSQIYKQEYESYGTIIKERKIAAD